MNVEARKYEASHTNSKTETFIAAGNASQMKTDAQSFERDVKLYL